MDNQSQKPMSFLEFFFAYMNYMEDGGHIAHVSDAKYAFKRYEKNNNEFAYLNKFVHPSQ